MLINIIFTDENGTQHNDVSYLWPAAPEIGATINMYAGPYKGKYKVVDALWEPTIDWTGNVQNINTKGCSVTLIVRQLDSPPTKQRTDDLARTFVEVSELASRQRQELLNTRSDLRDAQTQLQICHDQWGDMRKQRDAVMERASISLARAGRAEAALAQCQHDLGTMENKVEQADAKLATLQTPCPWRLDDDNWYMTGCEEAFPDMQSTHCPGCGHPIGVKEDAVVEINSLLAAIE